MNLEFKNNTQLSDNKVIEEITSICTKHLATCDLHQSGCKIFCSNCNHSTFSDKLKEMKQKTNQAIKDLEGKTSLEEINWEFIIGLSNRMDANKSKYPKNNWKKELDVNQLVRATMRHCIKILQPSLEDMDNPESILDHIEAIGCNAQMMHYLENKKTL